MFLLKDERRSRPRSDEPRVGTVTQLYTTLGYINDEVFFERRAVIGPMVKVGDTVAANVTFHSESPIKWKAEQVWRIEPDRSEDRRNVHIISYSRSSARKESRLSSSSADRFSERYENDRRHQRSEQLHTWSPAYIRNSRNSEPNDAKLVTNALLDLLQPNTVSNRLSVIRDLLAAELASLYKIISPPVYLYRVKCAWQDSFPINQPLQTSREVRFHQINKMAVRLVNAEKHDFAVNPSYAAGVILLGCPPPSDLYDRCVGPTSEVKPRPLTKCINMLAISEDGLRPVVGDWVPELDGPSPSSNPNTLINTAIRSCKDTLGLDLSKCSRWYRFLEFRYSRSEGQAWPSVEKLFAKGERWDSMEDGTSSDLQKSDARSIEGKSFRESAKNAANEKSSAEKTATSSSIKSEEPVDTNSSAKLHDGLDSLPPHRVVVYFVPDVWSIMPNGEQWEKIKAKYQDPKSYSLLSETTGLNVTKTDCAPPNDCAEKLLTGVKLEEKSEETPELLDSDPKEATDAPLPTAIIPTKYSPLASSGTALQTSKQLSTDEEVATKDNSRKMHHSQIDINVLKVSELREQLALRRLDSSGLKAQLSARLKVAVDSEAENEAADRKRKQEENAANSVVVANDSAAKTSTTAAAESSGGTGATKTDVTVTSPITSTPSGDKPEFKLPVLPDQPSLVVQLKQDSTFSLVVCSLETIITLSKGHYKPSNEVYELFVCANHILHMIHRDAIFTLYKALVTISDKKQLRSTQEPLTKSSEQPAKKLRAGDIRDQDPKSASHFSLSPYLSKSGSHTASSQPRAKIIDLPLLFACRLLDYSNKGCFSLYNIESFINALGLPVSRYQVRALADNVINSNKRLYYRYLVETPECKYEKESTSSKIPRQSGSKRSYEEINEGLLNELNGTPLSAIDDEEYLQELVRGGDAIFEEDEEAALTKVAPVVVCGLPSIDGTASEGNEVSQPSTAENFLNQLRRVENECLRLQDKLKLQQSSIDILKTENKEISKLREKLSKSISTVEHYRKRCHERKVLLSSTLQQLESQACVIEASAHSLRACGRKLKRNLANDEIVQPSSRASMSSPNSINIRSSSKAPSANIRDASVSGTNDTAVCDDFIKPSELQSTSLEKEAITKPMEQENELPDEQHKTQDHLHGDFDVNSDDSLESAPQSFSPLEDFLNAFFET